MELALVLKLQDRLIGPLRQGIDALEKDLQELNKQLGGTEGASNRAGAALGQLGDKAKGASKAKTEVRGLGEEADNARRKTEALGSSLESTFARLKRYGQGAAGAFAGYQAGKMVLAQPLQRAEDYELELAKLSNTAYNDRSTVAGRQAGQKELDQAIRKATLQGVSREDATTGLRTMIAAGVPRDKAMQMLPSVAKFAAAGEASTTDVANIAVKAQKNFGIGPDRLPKALEMALVAGQSGSFEFKDMARWLPQQMAMANGMLGMSGQADFARLLAANQMAANTAGGSAEAGNNLVNFLGKINSNDTANDAKKLGIDLPGSLAAARGKGVDPINAFLNMVEGTAAQDKSYTALQAKLKAAKGDQEKSATLQAMTDLLMGKSIGKLVQDRQALMGMLGILNDRAGFETLTTKIGQASGESDISQKTLMETTAMKNLQAETALHNAQYDALKDVNKGLADSKMKLAELSREYPTAAAAITGVTLAAGAAAASLSALSIAAWLQRGGAAAAAGSGVGTAATAGVAARYLGMLGKAGTGFAGLSVLTNLFGTTEEELQILRNADLQKAGYRGRGFQDPRIAAMQESVAVSERLGQASAGGPSPGSAAGASVDWPALLAEAKKPQEVFLRIDAPEFMTVQQISNQVARDASRR